MKRSIASRQIVERVGEAVARRRRRLSEARQVGRDHAEAPAKQRDEVAEHVARAREAVQQQDGRRRGVAGRAIEEFEAVDVDRAIGDLT